MKKIATISAVPGGSPSDFVWTWQSADEGSTPSRCFSFYFDCLTDARNHGYRVDRSVGCGPMAPSGAPFTLKVAGD